jgi:hypothetical protein
MPYCEEKRGSQSSWKWMICRCRNPKHPAYSRYKDVPICEKWNTFSGFFEDMGSRPSGTYLDRKSNKLGYTKSNCRWATPKESTENRSNTVWILFRGKKFRVSEFAEICEMPQSRVYHRLDRKWTPEEIFTKRKIKHGFTKNGVINPHRNHINKIKRAKHHD